MQTRLIPCVFLVCLLLGPLTVRGEEQRPEDAIRAMVDTERSFYRTGQEKGTRAAFLAFLTDDAIVFRPGPVNGKEVWQKRPESGLDLVWEPTFAAVARSADFGYTTGPARWKASKQEPKPLGYGHFVSIWKKQKEGLWKVALDLGIENSEPTGKPESLRLSLPSGSSPTGSVSTDRRQALQEMARRFAQTAKANPVEAIMEVAGDEIRVYRDGSFPAMGKRAAKALLEPRMGKTSLEPLGGDISSSADLAYDYGKYSLTRGEGTESGHFLHIWQTDPTGSWKLVLVWEQPLPKEKP